MGIIISDSKFRWPDGIIPFEIDVDTFPLGSPNRATIQSAIDHWNRNTIIRLQPRDSERDFVRFVGVTDGTCTSSVGRQGGRQTIGCDLTGAFNTGSIIHEIGHAVGLHHEHTREDRDMFVTIHFDNIKEDEKHNFEKKNKISQDIGVYDYDSIMHYGETSTNFAIDSQKKTLTALAPVGQRSALSAGDIATVAQSYSLTHERFFATFRKSDRPEIQAYKWKEQDVVTKYEELWSQGWRLRELQPYVDNGQLRYNAVWYESKSSHAEIQVYSWKYEDFRAKYDELWPQGWRLRILRTYVINSQVRYTAVWVKSKRDEIQVYGWKYDDFRAKYAELWLKGWRISILQPYVVNNQVLYNAVWRPSHRRETQVYGWKYNDFLRKHNELRRQGWRLHLVQPYRLGTELRCTAVWIYLPGRSERSILNREYARYKVHYDRLFSEGWRLHRLSVL